MDYLVFQNKMANGGFDLNQLMNAMKVIKNELVLVLKMHS